MKKFIGILLFFFLLSPLSATIYYVDKTTGNDGDSGLTEALAWETLTKINATAFSAGDIIKMKRGEIWDVSTRYLRLRAANGQGTSGNPITVTYYGTGALPIIDVDTSYALDVRSSVNYWEFDGLDFRGATSVTILIRAQSANVTGIKIKNCVVDGSSATHSIQFTEDGANTLTDVELDTNEIKDAGGDNVNAIKITSDFHAHHNTIHGGGEDGLDVAGGDDHIIEYNLIYDNETQELKIHGQQHAMNRVTVRYNILYKTKAVAGGFGISLNDSTDGDIFNNTIFMFNGLGNYAAMHFHEPNTGGSFTGNEIKNNNCYGNPTFNGGCWRVDNSIIDDFDIANTFASNCIYTTNATIVGMAGGVDITAANWVAVWLPNHPGDIKIDPLFINIANADFRLLMASPCINAGVDVGLTTDYQGRSIRHAPDIGAYEDPTNAIFMMTRLFKYLKERQ